jgi:DNA repair exonuclease SbcCD nuclease subunit
LKQLTFEQQQFIILGDVHFGARNDSQTFAEYFELLYEYLFEYMLKNDIKLIVQTGDMFDRRKYVNFKTLARAKANFFDKLRQHGFHVIVYLGNHDVAYRDTLLINSPTLLLTDYQDCVTVVTEPTELTIGSDLFLVLPWICADNHDLTMEAIKTTKAKICFGHLELSGFEMYKGAPCDHGMDPAVFWKFDKVYSGHFHHISERGNIHYVGSPYAQTWADYGDERGFFVFDKPAAKFVKNPYEMFFKILYDDVSQSMSDLLDADYSKYAKRYVKVIIREKNDLFLYESFIEKLEAVGAIVTVVDDHHYKDIETDSEIIESAETIDDMLKNVSAQYSEVVNSDKLFNLLMGLYTEATNLQVV